MKNILRFFLMLGLASCLWVALSKAQSYGQEQSGAQSQAQSSPEKSDQQKAERSADHASSEHRPGVGQQLAREEREAEGDEQEEHADLKYSSMVQRLARLTGLSVHGAHWLALVVNFAIIAFLFFWFGRKSVPGILRARSAAIQKALEEARAASQQANERLAEIEGRLRHLDVEVGKIQASSEKEAEGEEARIKKAAEEEIRKVAEAAEQEIAAAAKQARRELSAHTADLAIALARKQINVDANTDQVLVRDFAAKLTSDSPKRDGGKGGN